MRPGPQESAGSAELVWGGRGTRIEVTCNRGPAPWAGTPITATPDPGNGGLPEALKPAKLVSLAGVDLLPSHCVSYTRRTAASGGPHAVLDGTGMGWLGSRITCCCDGRSPGCHDPASARQPSKIPGRDCEGVSGFVVLRGTVERYAVGWSSQHAALVSQPLGKPPTPGPRPIPLRR